MATEKNRTRITLVSGEDTSESLKGKGFSGDYTEVDIIIRGPNGEDQEDLAVAARLCSCRRVCVALIEPV